MARTFKNLNINVFRVGPPSLIKLEWVWQESTIPLSRFSLDIWRGESPEELTLLVGNLPAEDTLHFEDMTARLKSKHRLYYYKVVATDNKTGKIVESPISTWEGDLDYVGSYIIEEHEYLFRWIAGSPVLIYKKQTDGVGAVRCPDCWDSVAKRVSKSNCQTCHGTGWSGKGVGGYYNPFYTWVDLSPDPKVLQVVQWGAVQPTQTDIMMTNYPQMSPGDLVIELLTGKRWKVANQRDSEKNRTGLLQILRMDMIEPGDIEYKIPIDPAILERARGEMNERKRIPEF